MKQRYHVVERTSPKGQEFVGTCRLCGKTGLTIKGALEFCENPRKLSVDDSLIDAIEGSGKDV